jgi:hypothetical protein
MRLESAARGSIMADTRAPTVSGLTRIADYLFGRNALIGVATLMLLAISCYATWSGLHDFIIGVSSTQGRPMPGGFAISSGAFVVGIVVALTFLMWLALRETFGAQRRISERLITFPLYLFLALWSIGFGYGFWWSLIAGNEATRTSLSRLQEDARDAASAIAARLQAVQAQLDNVVTWSDSQMAREENSGGSCGVPSNAGRGPLYNARHGVRDSVASLRDGITRSWLGPVQADLDQLSKSAEQPEGGTFGEREARFDAKAAEIRGRARSIAARSNELGASTAADMRALAAAVSIEPNQAGFSCYDPTLAQRLRQAADQAAQPAEPVLHPAAFSEGPAGVANAVKKLWTNVGAYATSLTHFVASGGKENFHRTENGEPITGRDVIALLATIGVDLGIFAMALLNPPATGPVRRDALAANEARLRLPTAAVVEHLKRAIQTAIARAPGDDANFEWVRRHFIHHNGSSYFVIPNLYHSGQDKIEELRALAMNQLAGVFADLKLVRSLTPSELQRLGKEEERDSYSSLAPFRERWREEHGETPPAAGADQPARRASDKVKRTRNHGLFSKAQRALDIAGWSPSAQEDVEIFRLVDTDGLTPLLIVLNDAEPNGTERHAPAVRKNGSAPESAEAHAAVAPADDIIHLRST